jgi:hypothetical protein
MIFGNSGWLFEFPNSAKWCHLRATGGTRKDTHWGAPQAQARPVMDIYDGADWTEMDIEDLKAEIAAGRSIEKRPCNERAAN